MRTLSTGLLLALLAGGCATGDTPDESDRLGQNISAGSWQLAAEHTLDLDNDGLAVHTATARIHLAAEVLGSPVVAAHGDRLLYSARPDLGDIDAELVAAHLDDGTWKTTRIARYADRPAISADGAYIAWVSGETGIPAVWVARFDGSDARQVTNVGMRPQKGGGEPLGFVAPPHDDSLGFEGHSLVWDSPRGVQQVEVIR